MIASRCASTSEKRKRKNETQAPRQPAEELGNMGELGVKRLIASCLNDACRHVGLIVPYTFVYVGRRLLLESE
jgi:hypothetical protein